MNYTKEIEKLRRDIERANRQEEEARMTRYFAYERISELQRAARSNAEDFGPTNIYGLPYGQRPSDTLAIEPPEET